MNEERYHPAHKAAIDEILLAFPGVKEGKAFGYPAYKVNGKVFAFVGGAGVSIKLPEERAKELIGRNHIFHFEPAEGIVWKSWVSITPPDPAMYDRYEAILMEALQFVAEQS